MSTQELTTEELNNLSGIECVASRNCFRVKITNGNKDLTIAELSLAISTRIDNRKVTITFVDEFRISPQMKAQSGLFFLNNDRFARFHCQVVGGKGYRH